MLDRSPILEKGGDGLFVEIACECRIWLRVILVFLIVQAHVSWADTDALNDWRHQFSRTQKLAENDAPSALQEAQRLQSQLPADASPVDRARVLNLLSRIENYMLQTEHAIAHAQQAQALAVQYKDRVGQAEADLNLVLGAASKGQLEPMETLIPHCMEMLEGSNRLDLLSDAMGLAALTYQRKGQVGEAIAVAMRAEELARQSGDPLALAYAYWGEARLFLRSDRPIEGRNPVMRMYEQARLAGSLRLQSAALVEWGRLLRSQGDLAGGEQQLRKAIDIAHRTGMPSALGIGLYALAENLHLQGRDAAAINVIDEAVALYEKYPHKTGLWWALHARGEYTQALGRDSKADAERAWQLAKEIGRPLYLVKSGQHLAAIAASHHDWKHAYEYTANVSRMLEQVAIESSSEHMAMLAKRFEEDSELRRIEALTRENERQQIQHRWMLLLAGVSAFMAGMLLFLVQQRRTNRRLAESNRQLKLSRDQLWESEQRLSTWAMHIPGFIYTFKLEPDGHGSFPYTSPGIRELLDLSPEDVQDDMMPLHLRMHIDDRPMIEAVLVDRAANLTEFHIEARALHPVKGEIWVEARSVPVRMPDGSFLYYGIMSDITQRKCMQVQLQESQTMLRALIERNESIREVERRHLAREVHDELGQMLNAVRLNLMVLERRFGHDNPEMRGMAGTMLEHLDNTIAIARNIVLALHPTVLDAGIALALDWLLRGVAKNTGIACNLEVDKNVALDETQSMAVFRIVQESLTNVARHSGASSVEILLVQDDTMYRLEISDNGRGFDVSQPRTRKSLGLIGMRERVFMLGGALDLTSAPGEGTVLRIEFPVIQVKEEIL